MDKENYKYPPEIDKRIKLAKKLCEQIASGDLDHFYSSVLEANKSLSINSIGIGDYTIRQTYLLEQILKTNEEILIQLRSK